MHISLKGKVKLATGSVVNKIPNVHSSNNIQPNKNIQMNHVLCQGWKADDLTQWPHKAMVLICKKPHASALAMANAILFQN